MPGQLPRASSCDMTLMSDQVPGVGSVLLVQKWTDVQTNAPREEGLGGGCG